LLISPTGRFALTSCSTLETALKPGKLTTEPPDWPKIPQ